MRIESLLKILLFGILAYSCTRSGRQVIPADISPDSAVFCPGYCIIENNNISIASAPFEGRIISVKSEPGKEVQTGQILAIIENSDFLLLQQEYLEAKNMVEFQEEEYARQGDLTVENATSIKKMQSAKRDYTAAELKYQTLRKHLVILGLNPDSLKVDKIKATLPVRSIGKGIVVESYIHRGSYVHKGEKMFEIAETRSLLLKLEVPEKYALKLQKDQKIEFYCNSDSCAILEATIISEAKIVDPSNHTAIVFAKPVKQNIQLLPGMSVKATIYQSNSKQ
ncbi:MAG TPA: efflux RND transporter periplasmic adaptor subunit [Bacteroidales bacterium]|jgi:cobalt-zinc-cadmium efflux system membrane fusion protein|nr:efflux RND transporter periplasmic adaptor subunit [Bacteroidales bacterium]